MIDSETLAQMYNLSFYSYSSAIQEFKRLGVKNPNAADVRKLFVYHPATDMQSEDIEHCTGELLMKINNFDQCFLTLYPHLEVAVV